MHTVDKALLDEFVSTDTLPNDLSWLDDSAWPDDTSTARYRIIGLLGKQWQRILADRLRILMKDPLYTNVWHLVIKPYTVGISDTRVLYFNTSEFVMRLCMSAKQAEVQIKKWEP